jgi:hypothetical protein
MPGSFDHLWILAPLPKVTDVKTRIRKRKPRPVQELSEAPHSFAVTNKTRAHRNTRNVFDVIRNQSRTACYTSCGPRQRYQCSMQAITTTAVEEAMSVLDTSSAGLRRRWMTNAHAKQEASGKRDQIKVAAQSCLLRYTAV